MSAETIKSAALRASDPSMSEHLLVKRLEEESGESQEYLAQARLQDLLEQASQPRHTSGNACIKLCYYLEQCRSSTSKHLRKIAFSKDTCLDLFNFYVEWNEKNQNRSMRQVLELLASLITRNPEELTSMAVRQTILRRCQSILARQTSQSLVKPAFKVLEFFLNKRAISPAELLAVFSASDGQFNPLAYNGTADWQDHLWDSFILDVFDWMVLSDIAPAAGKFLVTLFKELKHIIESFHGHGTNFSISWQRWIRNGLAKDTQAFENIKNYLFPPLFKIDRRGCLAFLSSLNKKRSISDVQYQEIDAHALLHLAAMDVGKKAGLVEDAGEYLPHISVAYAYFHTVTIQFHKAVVQKERGAIVLQEDPIGALMSSKSDTVRSLAFSVLVSSASSIRPFSPVAFGMLRTYIGIVYSDTDAKLRNEIIANTKNMIERIRGATGFLVRELDHVLFQLHLESLRPSQKSFQHALHEKIEQLLIEHEHFIIWYLNFLLGELIPTASYQRHITALKALQIILQSGILGINSGMVSRDINSASWPLSVGFFNPRSMRLLMDLLMDPFEDVRVAAAEILVLAAPHDFGIKAFNETAIVCGILPPDGNVANDEVKIPVACEPLVESHVNMAGQLVNTLEEFLSRGQDLSSRTGRADYADGLARAFWISYGLHESADDKLGLLEGLVRNLEERVEIAGKDLAQAVAGAPVHASFSALNLVCGVVAPSSHVVPWRVWMGYLERIVRSCSGIWSAVQDVLCNDSPEGHLPNEVDEMDSIDTKDVLSYSFRAVHESSNLMRTIVSRLYQSHPERVHSLVYKCFTHVGNLSFAQLSMLRHRGAISTVSLTFAVCCQASLHSNLAFSSADTNLLQQWWKRTIEAVHSQVSTTRRSAGLPALITGIMSADAVSPSFEEIMAYLKSQARSPITAAEFKGQKLPQVHALNGLRETFKNSNVRKRAEKHVLECLRIATEALTSKVWAIRNCGLLLFQSLINYLIGTQSKGKIEAGWDGGATAIAYERYPGLGELLIKLLEESTTASSYEVGSDAFEAIFPILDIFRRAGPPDDLQDRILSRLYETIGHRLWQIRELSARAFCALVPLHEWIKIVSDLGLMHKNEALPNENARHGTLLAATLLLERHLTPQNFALQAERLESVFNLCLSLDLECPHSPYGLAALLNLQNTVLAFIVRLIRTNSGNANSKERLLRGSEGCLQKQLSLHDLFHDGSNRANHAHDKFTEVRIASCKQIVYLSALRQDIDILQKALTYACRLQQSDILEPVLECITETWTLQSSEETLHKLAEIHLIIFEDPQFAKNSKTLATMLHNCHSICDSAKDLGSPVIRQVITNIDKILVSKLEAKSLSMTPSLEIAIGKVAGMIILSEILAQESLPLSTKSKIITWGKLLRDTCRYEKSFDARMGGAETLRSFFRNERIHHLYNEDCLLGVLFVLYDMLNDDDEDIREIVASAASLITGKVSTPLQAQRDLLKWMPSKYSHSVTFAGLVKDRMLGASATTQITGSLHQDDSLFVVESLNLFVDHVREVKSWAAVFGRLPKEVLEEAIIGSSALATLALWIVDGLQTLNSILTNDGGSLKSMSKPATYFACLRVLICTNAFIAFLTAQHWDPEISALNLSSAQHLDLQVEKILTLLKGFVIDGASQRVHPDLIFEVLNPDSLAQTKLELLLPGISDVVTDYFTLPLQLRRVSIQKPERGTSIE